MVILLILVYLGGSALVGLALDLSTNPQGDWRSMLGAAAMGPLIVPGLILHRFGFR
jgi:hypothetical protein